MMVTQTKNKAVDALVFVNQKTDKVERRDADEAKL